MLYFIFVFLIVGVIFYMARFLCCMRVVDGCLSARVVLFFFVVLIEWRFLREILNDDVCVCLCVL